jgi:hypothetical protein
LTSMLRTRTRRCRVFVCICHSIAGDASVWFMPRRPGLLSSRARGRTSSVPASLFDPHTSFEVVCCTATHGCRCGALL